MPGAAQDPSAPSAAFCKAAEFPALARAYARQPAARKIDVVHLHHTWIPNYTTFRGLGGGEAAGRELVRRMRDSHMRDRGFSDIAQHVSIDPEGRIWLGRPWNQQPASAKGYNGNAHVGPFMIEMIGDFDHGRDQVTAEQRIAAATVIASIQEAFGMPPEALRFHNEMSPKSCPGQSQDKNEWIREVGALRPQGRARSAGADARKKGPFPQDLVEGAQPGDLDPNLFVLMGQVLAPAAARSDRDEGELPDAAQFTTAEIERLEGLSGPGEDGLARAARGDDLTDEILRELRKHVINMNQGRFKKTGRFYSDESTVEELFRDHLSPWCGAQQGAGRTPRVVFYAHGGLVDEKQALLQAWEHSRIWKANGVYPVFFVWETGALETLWQIFKDRIGARGADARAWISDGFWETAARGPGSALWRSMKTSAERAADPAGAARFSVEVYAKHLKADGLQVETCVVGHSAGAIFHAWLVPVFLGEGVSVKSLQLLAPACTTDLFKAQVAPHLNKGLNQVRMFTMRTNLEQKDPTMQRIGYGKSILYAVSNAFEERQPHPILGLETSVRADRDLAVLFGLGGHPVQASKVIWSQSDSGARPDERTTSTTHGFDGDGPAMTSVLLGVLGRTDLQGVTPFETRRDLANPLGIRELLPDFGVAPAPSISGQPLAAATPAAQLGGGGGKLALCMGIDNYPSAPLSGCVNDAALWARTLEARGFVVTRPDQSRLTRRGLEDAVASILSQARRGDEVIIQYSGHGTRFQDPSGDEVDGADEAYVPIDCDTGGYLLDDEFEALVKANLPEGVRLTCILDCCHSGTITRARLGLDRTVSGAVARYLPPLPAMQAAYLAAKSARSAEQRAAWRAAGPSTMAYVALAACTDAQFAYEDAGQGRFTRVAAKVLSQERAISAADLHRLVRRGFSAADYRDQDPQIEGPQALIDAALFG